MWFNAKAVIERYKYYESTIVFENEMGWIHRLPVQNFLEAIHCAKTKTRKSAVHEVLVHKHELDISFSGENLRQLFRVV